MAASPLRRTAVVLLALTAIVAVGVRAREWWLEGRILAEPPSPGVPTDPGPERYLKGQLHAHSSNSGDSRTPPKDVVRWYESQGFDFVVFTDHNFVTQAPSTSGLLAIPGVEITQNLATCEPPPLPGQNCLIHVNALFVDPKKVGGKIAPASAKRLDRFTWAIEHANAYGGLAQINHPNFDYAADGPLLGVLAQRGARFLEIANQAVDANNAGDGNHPSTEVLWDAALSSDPSPLLWGTATDDAHHYYDAADVTARGETAFTGNRGFVMVKAKKDPESIRLALERGNFYSSTGVVLSRCDVGAQVVSVAASGRHQFRLSGERGEILSTITGDEATFDVAHIKSRYVRITVTDEQGHKAWLQPLRLASY